MAPRIRRAATVIPVRDGRIFLVRRSDSQRFFPGHWAFPGGTVDDADLAAAGGDEAGAFRVAALRELDEETGLKLADSALVESGRLLTPALAPVRYDTQFFLAEIPEGAEPVVPVDELAEGAWFRAADALKAFERCEMRIPPPTLALLRLLAEHAPHEAAARARATDGLPHHERFRIEFHPGIYALPLDTATLPPATTTNCYVLGGDRVVVVDPGPADSASLEPLRYLLSELKKEEGARFVGILLTHHHPDHVGGARWAADFLSAPVIASEATRTRLGAGIVDEVVKDGDTLDLGFDEDSGRPWRLEVLETPGHAQGHLAFRDTRHGAVLVGDLMSGISTIVIDPPEGDMAQYLASLARIRDLDAPVLLPAHGPAFTTPRAAVDQLIAHRLARESRVVEALAKRDGPASAGDLVADAYDDTPEALWPVAERSLEAILLKLEGEGRVRREGALWHLAA